MLALALCAGLLAPPVSAETVPATVVAGHPPVFRWVRHLSESFTPPSPHPRSTRADAAGSRYISTGISSIETDGGSVNLPAKRLIVC